MTARTQIVHHKPTKGKFENDLKAGLQSINHINSPSFIFVFVKYNEKDNLKKYKLYSSETKS